MKRWPTVLALSALIGLPPASGTAGTSGGGWSAIPPEVLAQYAGKDSGRYLVLLRERADLGTAAALPTRDARRMFIVDALRSTAERSQRGLLAMLEAGRSSGLVSSFRPFWLVNVIAVESDRAMLRAIAARPEVRAIAPDRRRTIVRVAAQASPAPDGTAEWNIERVGAPEAWRVGIEGSGVVVASIDTGVDVTHPSLATKYRGADGDDDYDWWDAIARRSEPYDDEGHGTHTMGTMVGGDGEGPDPDDIGVAPGATWISAKAFNEFGGGLESWILEAAQFLTAPTKLDGSDPRPDLAPDVVNNSWGGGSCDPWFDDVLTTWRAMDIFPAFAIGNAGPDPASTGSPGDSPHAFAVGATEPNDEIASFSSRGPSCNEAIKPEVSAPGVDVRSSVPGGGFFALSGTSMAAPHVAGAVALIDEAAAGSLTVAEVEDALTVTALDLGTPGADNDYGAGRLQAFEAVRLALRGGTLEGVATDGSGGPLEHVEISAQASGETSRRTFTDVEGRFRLRLVEGAWEVTATAFGFLPASSPATIVEQQVTTLNFALVLAPRVTVSGVVNRAPEGTPVAGAAITVLDTPLPPATTDAAGGYSIVVPIGTYTFEAAYGSCVSRPRAMVTAAADLAQHFTLERVLDPFGYTCDEVVGAHEPGTVKLNLTGDDARQKIALPFPFSFYGRNYGEAWVHTNGFVSFEDIDPEYVNRPIPDADPPNGAIYALWDDLFVRGAVRGVYTATLGASPVRSFVIEYRNFELLATGDLVTISIVLGEGGSIEVRYRTVEGRASGLDATIGIEDPSGGQALQYAFERPVLSDGATVRYALGSFGTFEGTVVSAADGLPISGATVSIGDRSAPTDAAGRYRLASFAGSYNLVSAAQGYGATSATASVEVGSVTRLDFSLDAPRALPDPTQLSFRSTGEAQTDVLTLSNPGQMPLVFEVATRSQDWIRPVIDDPIGDADGSVDIGLVEGGSQGDVARFRVGFSPSTPTNEVVGYIHLDTDQNSETGPPPFFGAPGQDIGYEYYLDLFNLPESSTISLWDQEDRYIDEFPAAFDGQVLSFDVPLEDLGEDDGNLDVTMVLGDFFQPTDWAPDEGHGTIALSTVPWLDVEPASGELAPGEAQRLDVTADPIGMAPGDYPAEVVVSSNDPRAPDLSVPVTLHVIDHLPPVTAFAAQGVVIRSNGDVLRGTATDDSSGVEELTVVYTPLLGGTEVAVPATLVCDEQRLACAWSASAPESPGPFAVSARARDRAGNVEDPGPSTVVVVV